MTSKAQRAKAKKRRTTQRRGRKLKPDAPRFGCGKAKPERVMPNEVVVASRAARAGDATPAGQRAAENPLDLAKHLGLIAPVEHRAGEMLAELYRKSGFELPDLRTQDLAKVSKAHSPTLGDPRSMSRLAEVAKALHHWPKPRQAMFAACILNAWPEWMSLPESDIRHTTGRNRLRLALRLTAITLGIAEAPPSMRLAS